MGEQSQEGEQQTPEKWPLQSSFKPETLSAIKRLFRRTQPPGETQVPAANRIEHLYSDNRRKYFEADPAKPTNLFNLLSEVNSDPDKSRLLIGVILTNHKVLFSNEVPG